jgi:cytochrome c peroxidase
MKKILVVILTTFVIFSCSNNTTESTGEAPKSMISDYDKDYSELDAKARRIFKALPDIAISENNSVTDEKVALGKMLYFDNRLSKDNTQSCNTCHNLNTFGVDNKAFSEGNDGGLGGRNSPTTLNAALHMAQFWDGREADVESQAGGPILNPVEMAMPSEKAVIDRLSGIEDYVVTFAKAFPEDANPISYSNLKKAIGAFERKLITKSPFDDYLSGNDNALTGPEKDGLQTFMDVGCITCHSGVTVGGNMYQKFGLSVDYWEYTNSENIDLGRFDVTGEESDKYMFKVPSLLNIEKTGPYFHDGSVDDLAEAIKIMGVTELNKELSESEISAIVVFLSSMTGEVPNNLKNP